MSPNDLETTIIKLDRAELINFAFDNTFLDKEQICITCNKSMNLVKYMTNIDNFAWRCMNVKCLKYKQYKTIRLGSFFEGINLDLAIILRIVIKYATRQSRYSIKAYFNLSLPTMYKIIDKIVDRIPDVDFSASKLGGPGKIVQVDETTLNYQSKSHRQSSFFNKTDSLCIAEIDTKVTRVFATVIADKKESTLVPIICSQVAFNSIIWTDEHKFYTNLVHTVLYIKLYAINTRLYGMMV